MDTFAFRIPATVALFACCASAFAVGDVATLEIRSSATSVKIDARANDSFAVNLPSITFLLQVDTNCAGEQRPRSVLLSIADTRKRIFREQLEGSDTTFSITLPKRQSAPLSISDFCVLGDGLDAAPDSGLTVPGAFSVQGALFCADESSEQVVYASSPLDITVYCSVKVDSTNENVVLVTTPPASADAKN